MLDGVADSRRLDPFSGENRTMKSNLLYRGQESEYGYVWMELRRPLLAKDLDPGAKHSVMSGGEKSASRAAAAWPDPGHYLVAGPAAQ